MIKVKAVQDDNSHWYLVPNEKVDEFYELLNLANEKDDYEGFDIAFGDYRTGEDINNKQLYVEMKKVEIRLNNIIMEFTAIPDKIEKSKGLKPIFMKIKKKDYGNCKNNDLSRQNSTK